MGKASRIQSRADLAAARRAEAARKERRRKQGIALAAVIAVVAVIGGMVLIKVLSGGDSSAQPPATTAGDKVARSLTSVPAATLDQIGIGSAVPPGGGNLPSSISAPPLKKNGKPYVLYVGAEYCPYCASQRWPLVLALSRFGTWSGLGLTTSASDDVYANTPTLTFHGASYSSKYVAFHGVETATNERQGNAYAPLDKLSAGDEEVYRTYNQPPYVPSAGGIPFLDIGGSYVMTGSSFTPQLLADKTQEQIAAAVAKPDDPIAQAIGGTANALTAAICEITDSKPADVCSAPGVKAAAGSLGQAQ